MTVVPIEDEEKINRNKAMKYRVNHNTNPEENFIFYCNHFYSFQLNYQ